MRVSYSSASLFEKCPARWKAEKVDHVQGERPLHLEVGVLLHEVTEAYLRHLQRAKASHDYPYAERAFAEFWQSRPQSVPESAHEEVLGVWESIKEHLVLPRIEEVVEPELSIALRADWTRTTWDAADAWLRLKIDRLEVAEGWRVRIWDLKTGWKIEAPEDSMQGKLYGAVVRRILPQAQCIAFELYYPRFDITRTYEMASKDFEEGERWITRLSARMEEAVNLNAFKATPGGACMDCPIFYSCPARQRSATVQPPRDRESAERMVEQLLMVNREHDDLQGALKTWIEASGPVEVNGMIAQYSLTERLQFPMERLLPLLREAGIEPEKALKPDNDKLERFAKKNDALRSALAKIQVNRSTSTFKIKKAGV